ncbi:hypothetical protein ABZ733_07250 [Streptomyces longwoodensis]|uniref:hypothetical protein n=1 Tax=Streptomyces longwoodensis TaxID=68231 RepID=UPI0033EFDD12
MTAEPQPIICTGAERRLAVEHWLLSTLPNREARAKARAQWAEHGLAMLPLGGLMSAVRIPAALVQALARTVQPPAMDAFLADALDGGPVVCSMHGGWRYYALVPGRMPRTWHDMAARWQGEDVDCLGRGAYLGVPPVDRTGYDRGTRASYWSVPMESLGALCDPLVVARFTASAMHAAAALEGAAS